MLSLLISRIIFNSLFCTTNLISGRICLLGWLCSLWYSPPSLNPYCSFAVTRVFMVLFIWMIFLAWLTLSMLERTPSHTALFPFDFFRIQWTFLSSFPLKTSWDPAIGSCLVTEANHFGLSCYVLLGQNHLLCQWPCKFTSCAVSFRVTCWMFTILLLICFFPFTFPFQCSVSFRRCLNCSRVQCPWNFSSWCGDSLPTMLEWVVRLVCLRGCTKQCYFWP